eukprot:g2734.t1
MDFDLTMTAPGSEQCHHMFETSSALPAELRNRLAPFIAGEVELTTRDAWWEGFHAVLCDARITKAQVAAVAGAADLTLRSGTAELMLLLHERGVPLLVVSAGITDIVAETLRLHGLLLDNVTVRANTMLFGEDERLERFRESPPVHSRNKDQTAEREKSYFFESHQHRRCVVVVGDKPGDADVTIGLAPDDRCLKIGFFDHSHEHPHPDLPPIPPPRPAPEGVVASNRRAGGNNGRESSGVMLGGLGFLRGANTPVLLERGPVTGGGGAFLSTSSEEKGHEEEEDEEDEEERIKGRPGSQGLGEVFVSNGGTARVRKSGEGGEPVAAVAVDEMLRAYGDSFDVVACGGHSMDIVADFVRHFTDACPPDGAAAACTRDRN